MNTPDSGAVKVIHAIDDARRSQVLDLFQSVWWTAARSSEAVDRMIEGSDVVVGLVDSASDRLVGFARAITDGVFLAVVLDVIVAPDVRGAGHGARLMDELLARPELAGADSIELVCQPDLIEFYRRFGFTDRGPIPAHAPLEQSAVGLRHRLATRQPPGGMDLRSQQQPVAHVGEDVDELGSQLSPLGGRQPGRRAG
jgi:GNAT superfamily N-acetyltransferase